MNTSDRRRVALAAAFTVVAMPALWVINRDDAATGPTVGAVGVESPQVATDDTIAPYEPDTPIFLDAPNQPAPPAVINIVVPPSPTDQQFDGRATFRRIGDATSMACTTNLAPIGETLAVRNLDNGQEIACVNTYGTNLPPGVDIVLQTELLAKICDLADAPVHVRVSW